MPLVVATVEKRIVAYFADPDFVTFVAKTQKARTRKNRDYFVLRATVPKEVAEKLNVKAGDHLLFKAKKAQWYHLLEWNKMGSTWKMLPDEIRNRVVIDGLYNQGIPSQVMPSLGATNLSAPPQQMLECRQT
jgi:hypothetical protein